MVYLRDIVMILIFFGIIVGIGAIIVTDMANQYNVQNMTSAQFEKNYNTLQDIGAKTEAMKNYTSGGKGLVNVGSFTTIVSGTWSVFQLVFRSVTSIKNVFVNFASTYIPSNIATILLVGLVAGLSSIIVFVIISAVLKGRV